MEDRDVANPPLKHKATTTTNNDLAPNIDSAEAEQACDRKK